MTSSSGELFVLPSSTLGNEWKIFIRFFHKGQRHWNLVHRLARPLGFSILELIIVITLTSILLFFINLLYIEARSRSLSAKDIGNLRQLGQAAHLYIADHNNYLPPVAANGMFAHEHLAVQLSIDANLRDRTLSPTLFGPLISATDRRPVPQLSPLRSYAVNYYMGEVGGKSDSGIVRRYNQIVYPSRVLYLLPGAGTKTGALDQARFSEYFPPFRPGTTEPSVRFDSRGVTPALYADGHVAPVLLNDILANPKRFIVPNHTED